MFYNIRLSRIYTPGCFSRKIWLSFSTSSKFQTSISNHPGTHPTFGKIKFLPFLIPPKKIGWFDVRVEWFRKVKRISRRPWEMVGEIHVTGGVAVSWKILVFYIYIYKKGVGRSSSTKLSFRSWFQVFMFVLFFWKFWGKVIAPTLRAMMSCLYGYGFTWFVAKDFDHGIWIMDDDQWLEHLGFWKFPCWSKWISNPKP